MTDEELEREAFRFHLGHANTIEDVIRDVVELVSIVAPAGQLAARTPGIVDDATDRIAGIVIDLQAGSFAAIDSIRRAGR